MAYALHPYQVSAASAEVAAVPENLLQINAPLFWEKSKGDGIVVAVIDTGLHIGHPDFAGRIVSPANFTRDGDSPGDVVDREGHGTHVAGIIGGTKTGVAPRCRIMPIKTFGDANGFQFQDAFRYIYDYNKTAKEADKVRVINCSWGGPYDPVVHYIIRELVASGVVVVVAAGNQGDGNPDTAECFTWPAFLYEVITVGALDLTGQQHAGFSSSYEGIDLAAPGTSILSTWPEGGYKNLSGTSMAAPHVSGAYALIMAAWYAREGRYPTEEEATGVLFKHIKTVPVDNRLVGLGLLDLAWKNTRWPLHRIQLGAYYNKLYADEAAEKVKAVGFGVYHVKY